MLYNYQRGYSVRTRKDLKLISFESESLDDCMQFCHDDSVIVELIPIKCGFNLRVWISDYNHGIKYDKYANSLYIGKLVIQVTPEWKHKVSKIVYEQFDENSDSDTWWNKCERCKNFEGYDMCLAKGNFGAVTDISRQICKEKQLFIEKDGN